MLISTPEQFEDLLFNPHLSIKEIRKFDHGTDITSLVSDSKVIAYRRISANGVKIMIDESFLDHTVKH
jgi:hypothetical protein